MDDVFRWIILIAYGTPVNPLIIILLTALATLAALSYLGIPLEVLDRLPGPVLFLISCAWGLSLFLLPAYTLFTFTVGLLMLGVFLGSGIYIKALVTSYEKSRRNGSGITYVIVDGDESYAATLISVIAEYFYPDAEYDIYLSGERFLEIMDTGKRYDLYLVNDVLREGMNGYELIEEILNRDPEATIVGMKMIQPEPLTSVSTYRKRFRKAGAEGMLIKDNGQSFLASRLKRYFS